MVLTAAAAKACWPSRWTSSTRRPSTPARQFMRRLLGAHAAQRAGAAQYDAEPDARRLQPGRAVGRQARPEELSPCSTCPTLDDTDTHALAQAQYDQAGNMTDRIAALSALHEQQRAGPPGCAGAFLHRVRGRAAGHRQVVRAAGHVACDRCRRGARADAAPGVQHEEPEPRAQPDLQLLQRQPVALPRGRRQRLRFWAEQVIALDAINPQVSARLARTLDRWRKYAPALQSQMQDALQRVAATPKLSKDLSEVINKSLATD